MTDDAPDLAELRRLQDRYDAARAATEEAQLALAHAVLAAKEHGYAGKEIAEAIGVAPATVVWLAKLAEGRTDELAAQRRREAARARAQRDAGLITAVAAARAIGRDRGTVKRWMESGRLKTRTPDGLRGARVVVDDDGIIWDQLDGTELGRVTTEPPQ